MADQLPKCFKGFFNPFFESDFKLIMGRVVGARQVLEKIGFFGLQVQSVIFAGVAIDVGMVT